MKTFLHTLIIVLFTFNMLAQEVPLIKVGEDRLGIEILEIDVKVIGNIVTTTYDMKFYNPTNNILEGELIFPLGENQSVSRFALDVNGKIREAVVVEKEQGRIAFEAVVRRRVDPALLEKGTGNNYRARIYPIPAKGYKQIIIAYQEELKFTEGIHQLTVPLSFKKELELFSLNVSLLNQNNTPRILSKNPDVTFFEKAENNFFYRMRKENYKPNDDFSIEIPLESPAKISKFQDYLYVYKTLDSEKVEKNKPSKVKILWDVSYSMKGRDLEKEFQYLNNYFQETNNVDVELVTFSNIIVDCQNFSVVNGIWNNLQEVLENSIYDGATSYTSLINFNNRVDEIVMFTDGMYTLSDFPKDASNPVYIINSIKKANHNGNNLLSKSSSGSYINLVEISIKEAIEKTFSIPKKFLSYKVTGNDIELFPIPGSQVFNDFSISAKGVKPGQQIELYFGYGDIITETVLVEVPLKNNASKQVSEIWAKGKVEELQKNNEENKDEIVVLAKEYQLITNHTSLIVLEDVYDYIRYDILPPEELMAEYLQIKGKKDRIKIVNSNSTVEVVEEENSQETISEVRNNERSLPTGSQITVQGTVVDNTGMPLPGVNIIVAGSSQGTQSDFDGNYSINISVGKDLVYTYVGFVSLVTTVQNSGNINITMEEDAGSLEEVVVTAQGIKREKKALGYAVSTITSEKIQDNPQSDLTRVLSGKSAGVIITTQNGMSGSTNNVIIRGMNSFSGNNNPLYIIDGVPFSTGTNAAGSFIDGNMGSSRSFDIDPNNIEKIEILKGLAATTLYGTEGRNGVILITTKTNLSSTGSGSSNYRNSAVKKLSVKMKKSISLAHEKTIEEKGFVTAYLSEFETIKDSKKIYAKYLKQREKYKNLPAYFVDVYDFMKGIDLEIANRILSNIAEIDADNYELLKVLTYKLEEQGSFDLAVIIYRKILKLRPEDVQSHRDLALALQEIGQFEEALGLLNSIANGSVYEGNQRRKFKGMENITINEMRNIIHTQNVSYNVDEYPLKVVNNYDMDIRVVIDWNHNDTDIDLHVIDPNIEECSYMNTKTNTGGELSKDMTSGFGPEEFKQKFATTGTYYLKVNYYGDRYQKIENPTFMKLTIFRNYGRKNQSKEIKVIRLSGRYKKQLIERISI